MRRMRYTERRLSRLGLSEASARSDAEHLPGVFYISTASRLRDARRELPIMKPRRGHADFHTEARRKPMKRVRAQAELLALYALIRQADNLS